jgi:hypothetical protein
MNPLVSPHLDYMLEQAHGRNIYKLSQSEKWLKHLAPDLRGQMVESDGKQFYIFEPVQLQNLEITVPVFFYTENTHLFSKCYTPSFKSNDKNTKIQIGIPDHISFDDENLKIIPIEELSLTYQEIKVRNGMDLADCFDGKINGENFMQFMLYNLRDDFLLLLINFFAVI